MLLKCRAERALELVAGVLVQSFLPPSLKELLGAGAEGVAPLTPAAFCAELASPPRWHYQTVLVDPPPCFGLA